MSPYKLTYDEFHQIVHPTDRSRSERTMRENYKVYCKDFETFRAWCMPLVLGVHTGWGTAMEELIAKEKLNLLKETIDAL